MQIHKTIQDDIFQLTLEGKFTFSDHKEFRSLFSDLTNNKTLSQVSVDLKHVSFVDSAALGMLLLLKDEVEKANKKLILLHPAGQVKKLFEISRFYEIFTVID